MVYPSRNNRYMILDQNLQDLSKREAVTLIRLYLIRLYLKALIKKIGRIFSMEIKITFSP